MCRASFEVQSRFPLQSVISKTFVKRLKQSENTNSLLPTTFFAGAMTGFPLQSVLEIIFRLFFHLKIFKISENFKNLSAHCVKKSCKFVKLFSVHDKNYKALKINLNH